MKVLPINGKQTIKALSVRQPWGSLIIHGPKRIENRQWAAPRWAIGERIAIHASAGAPSELPDSIRRLRGLPSLDGLPRGAIIGSALLYDCLHIDDLPRDLHLDPFAEGDWCWLLRDVRPLPTPFVCKGALRLWDVPEAARAVLLG